MDPPQHKAEGGDTPSKYVGEVPANPAVHQPEPAAQPATPARPEACLQQPARPAPFVNVAPLLTFQEFQRRLEEQTNGPLHNRDQTEAPTMRRGCQLVSMLQRQLSGLCNTPNYNVAQLKETIPMHKYPSPNFLELQRQRSQLNNTSNFNADELKETENKIVSAFKFADTKFRAQTSPGLGSSPFSTGPLPHTDFVPLPGPGTDAIPFAMRYMFGGVCSNTSSFIPAAVCGLVGPGLSAPDASDDPLSTSGAQSSDEPSFLDEPHSNLMEDVRPNIWNRTYHANSRGQCAEEDVAAVAPPEGEVEDVLDTGDSIDLLDSDDDDGGDDDDDVNDDDVHDDDVHDDDGEIETTRCFGCCESDSPTVAARCPAPDDEEDLLAPDSDLENSDNHNAEANIANVPEVVEEHPELVAIENYEGAVGNIPHQKVLEAAAPGGNVAAVAGRRSVNDDGDMPLLYLWRRDKVTRKLVRVEPSGVDCIQWETTDCKPEVEVEVDEDNDDLVSSFSDERDPDPKPDDFKEESELTRAGEWKIEQATGKVIESGKPGGFDRLLQATHQGSPPPKPPGTPSPEDDYEEGSKKYLPIYTDPVKPLVSSTDTEDDKDDQYYADSGEICNGVFKMEL